MICKSNYKGLQYTLATAKTGGVCINTFDDNTRTFVFASGICKDKQQLLQLISNTKRYYNDMLDNCRRIVEDDNNR